MIKLLVLDDTPDVVEILGVSLSRHFTVTGFTRGIDALQSIIHQIQHQQPYDFLLLDCSMPHLDAFTIAQIVRLIEDTGLTPRHKIGVFTAYPDIVENTSLLERSRIDYYWRKPEDVVDLPQLVLKAIEAA